jgi:hypothetical protein
MGSAKEYGMEFRQQKDDEILAERLGITYDELLETEWYIETEESNDGMIYGYVVYFNNAPKHILKKIRGLNSDNQVWINPFVFDQEDYYDYEDQYNAIISNKQYYDNFVREINSIQELNKLQLENGDLDKVLRRQLYVAIVGIFEAFLSETFINQIDENTSYFRNFVETFPQFSTQKFQLKDIFQEYEKLKKTVQKAVLEVIYHNLDKVQNMYVATFNIEFPDIGELSKVVTLRHDLVHRNGKTKEGEEVIVTPQMIKALINSVIAFVDEISEKLQLRN